MTFQEWTKTFLESSEGDRAIILLDDTIDPDQDLDYTDTERPDPVFFYRSTPTYQELKNMLLAACYYAATCPLEPNFRKESCETKLRMNEATQAIKQLRAVIREHPEEFNWLAFFALAEIGREGVKITGGPSRYDKLIDNLLASMQRHSLKKNIPAKFEESKAANLFFSKTVERSRTNPIRDGLIFQLAFLIKDWCSGKREAFALGYGYGLQHRGNAHPEVISAIVSAALQDDFTAKQVTQRLKDLKKARATIHAWPHEGEINS